MRHLNSRADKLALLSKIVEGRLTDKVVSDIRKSREPIRITMNIGDGESPLEPNDPTYYIEISDNWKCFRRYNRYADGRIEELDDTHKP